MIRWPASALVLIVTALPSPAQFALGPNVRAGFGFGMAAPRPFPIRPPFWGWVGPPIIVMPPPIVIVVPPPLPPDDRPPPMLDDAIRPVGAEFVVPFVDRVMPIPKTLPGRGEWKVGGIGLKPADLTPVSTPAGALVMPGVNVDRAEEAARLVGLAREAFSASQYGRAVERLARAIELRPGEPLTYFLKAQAEMARGKYADAVADIRDGLAYAPAWPASGFRLKGLYLKPDELAAQVADLRRALAGRPDDPTLQFLLGYQLWFLGEKEEAVRLFRQAERKVKDSDAIRGFLRMAER